MKYIYKYIKFKSDFKVKNNIENNINKNEINFIRDNSANDIINNNQANTIINIMNNSGEMENDIINKKEEDISEIIEKFYEKCYNHISRKISYLYSMSECESVIVEEYERLKELRDVIINKDLFTIEEIRNEIQYYPAKYSKIFQKRNNIKDKNNQIFQI